MPRFFDLVNALINIQRVFNTADIDTWRHDLARHGFTKFKDTSDDFAFLFLEFLLIRFLDKAFDFIFGGRAVFFVRRRKRMMEQSVFDKLQRPDKDIQRQCKDSRQRQCGQRNAVGIAFRKNMRNDAGDKHVDE